MFDALRYLRAFRVPHTTEGPKSSTGWVNIACPLCKSHKEHGGFNLDKGYYHCWRCGWHPLEEVIMALERVPHHTACARVNQYQTTGPGRPLNALRSPPRSYKALPWPKGVGPLLPSHGAYLRGRGFDPHHIEQKYGVRSATAGAWAGRLMIPVLYNGMMVSFQGRDVTGTSPIKYKACPKNMETVHHKDILYNLDNAANVVLIVEGVMDVWRIGDGAIATFGISYTPAQVKLIIERTFKQVFILFDCDQQANSQARKLRDTLLQYYGAGFSSVKLLHKGDPGELTPAEAINIRKEVGL